MKNSDAISAAIYARVSSEQQAEAATIASQVAALEERAANDGLTLEPGLRFLDEGYSGATLVRPALERLRDVAATGAIDRLYVHSPDRLARKYAYQVLLVDEFYRCGMEVVFLNHPLGQTPDDNLLLQVQGMVAEYERAKILERSRRGKLYAARQGSVNVLSGAPYGYHYVSCREGDGEARYEIVLEEARVVRKMFEWVGRDGLSIGEVCRRLKKQGIPSPTGKSYWDRATVWGHLKNSAYRGSAIFGKTRIGPQRPRLRAQRGRPEQPRRAHSVYDVPEDQGIPIPVPAIVSEELFAAAQERREENRKRNRQSRRGARYLLQGLIVCRHCGYAFYGKPVSLKAGKGKRRNYAYYRCIGTDAYRFGGERICQNKQVRTDLLEEVVWQDVCSLLENPQRIEREYQRRLKRDPKGSEGDQQLPARIQKIKRGIARLVDAYEEGLLEKHEFEPRLRRSRDRLAKLEADAKQQADDEAQRVELRLVIGHLQEFADRIKECLRDADWTTRREILRALVKRVEVDETQVRVIYRVDSLPFDQRPKRGGLQDCLRRKRTTPGCPLVHRTDQPVFHHPRVEERTDELQHALVGNPCRNAGHQQVMVDSIEEFFEVDVDHVVVALGNVLLGLGHGLLGRASRSESVAVLGKRRVPPRLQDLKHRLLDQSVDDTRHAELSDPAIRLGDFDPLHRLRRVGSCQQLFPNGWPVLTQVGHAVVDSPPIDSGASLVFPDAFPRPFQVFSLANLLHESFFECWAFGGSLRREWFGPSAIGVRGCTSTFHRKGQTQLLALGFLPLSTHELRVLLATPYRSGLQHVATALRSLAVSALSGQCPDRAGRRLMPTMPSADSCAAVRSPCGFLSPEFETRRRSPEVSSIAFTAHLPDLQPRP